MDKIWLKSYPEEVPAEVDVGQYDSLVHLLEEAFEQYGERHAYVCMDKFLRYRELEHFSRCVGAWLQHAGLQKGARVALMMPNVLPYPVALAGILRAGYVVVNVNPLYKARELRHQLADSGAQAIIILENFASTLEKALDGTQIKHVIIARMGDMLGCLKGAFVNFAVRYIKKMVPPYSLPGTVTFKEVLRQGARLAMDKPVLHSDDLAFLQYTGGTTGVAKGAMLKHGNIIANVLQNEAWIMPVLRRLPEDKVLHFICALPLYHVFALTVCCMTGLRLGAINILIPNPRDIGGLIRELGKYPFNLLPGVNTLYNGLLNHPDFQRVDFSNLLLCNGGGMMVQKVVSDRWHEVTGVHIIEGYGLSETSPTVASNPVTITGYSGTIGVPLPSTMMRIIDENGDPVPFGQAGEIAIKGPQVMAGYWNSPEETAQCMTADGYFKSGDIGIMNEAGHVRIVDRKKDMIVVSGFNVYPSEIEDVVAAHPGVLECACIGVPDAKTGEAVKLFVVRRDPTLTEDALQQYCREQFTGYKKPKYILFCESLPKSNVGKIIRRELRGTENTT